MSTGYAFNPDVHHKDSVPVIRGRVPQNLMAASGMESHPHLQICHTGGLVLTSSYDQIHFPMIQRAYSQPMSWKEVTAFSCSLVEGLGFLLNSKNDEITGECAFIPSRACYCCETLGPHHVFSHEFVQFFFFVQFKMFWCLDASKVGYFQRILRLFFIFWVFYVYTFSSFNFRKAKVFRTYYMQEGVGRVGSWGKLSDARNLQVEQNRHPHFGVASISRKQYQSIFLELKQPTLAGWELHVTLGNFQIGGPLLFFFGAAFFSFGCMSLYCSS